MINNGFNDLEDELNNAIKEKCDKSYNKGLEDAWELARKIYEMKSKEFDEVFRDVHYVDVFYHFTPQEALTKLEVYEKSKEIEVGDVVVAYNQEGIVVGYMYGIDECDVWMYGYESPQCINKSEIKKTGKHIDINSVLEQLRGE